MIGPVVIVPMSTVMVIPAFVMTARDRADGQEQAGDDYRNQFCFHETSLPSSRTQASPAL